MGKLIAFLGIIVMIVLHEWGHYIAARLFKVPVYEFSIGMGPKLFQRKMKNGTLFSIRAVPLGGYCAFDDATDSGIQDAALNRIPIYQKIIICVAGPFINLLTGFLVFLTLTAAIGISTPTNTVLSVNEDMPAYEILQENDEILKINGILLDEDNMLTDVVMSSEGKELDIKLIRDGKQEEVKITPVYDKQAGRYYIGVVTASIYEKTSFTNALKTSWTLTIDSIKQVYGGLFQLITGKVKLSQMSGIVGIVAYAGDFATLATIYSFFAILAIISINLGIMNLLPIPGLDGSKILFGIIEILRGGKRIPEEIESKFISVSFAFLVGLMIIIAVSDIIKLLF